MDSLIGSVDPQVVLVVAALAVLVLSVMLLIRIVKAGGGLILAILAIVLVVHYGFGISTNQIWGEIGRLPQDVTQIVKSFDLNALSSVFSG